MASTTLDPIAARLTTLAAGLVLDNSATVKAYKWAPRELDSLPGAVVEMPGPLTRTAPDEAEGQLGANDWDVDFPVVFYFELSKSAVDIYQAQAVETVEAWVKAVDADQTLNGTVTDARVVEVAAPEIFDESDTRAQIRYRTRVSVLKLVNT